MISWAAMPPGRVPRVNSASFVPRAVQVVGMAVVVPAIIARTIGLDVLAVVSTK
ncbi:hypothetical protein D3C73_1581080 [compost metagenome]